MKYFKLSRNDGIYWIVGKISIKLQELNLTEADNRSLRNYDDEFRKLSDGHFYKLKRFIVDNFDGLEFGEFGNNKPIVRDFSQTDIFEVDEYELERQELIDLYLKVKKQLQKRMDTQRIERKTLRSENRWSSIIEDTFEKLLERVEVFKPNKPTGKKVETESSKVGVMFISDLHIGEVVDLDDNQFNSIIAEKRLNEYTDRCIERFDQEHITDINLVFTGDLLNLDNHTDKKLTNEAQRAESFEKLYGIISSMIDRLLDEDFSLKIASCVGNEGRFNSFETMSNVNKIALDNFDYMLLMMLRVRYEKQDEINFLNNGDKIEDMIEINGKHFILLHGNNLKHNKLADEVEKVKLRWWKKTNIMADFVVFGHIHSPLITNTFARSGSLVGANGYSDTRLNIPTSCASQNIGIVGDTIEITPIILR